MKQNLSTKRTSEPRLHIDGYGYGYGFGYGDRKRQDFEIFEKGTRTHTGYVSYRVRVRVRDLEEVPMLHRSELQITLHRKEDNC